jgi:dTDP-glucose 4,6-dehydratase
MTRNDAEVVNLDALRYAGNLESLTDVEGHPRYRFVRADVCDGDAVLGAMDGVDVVLHLAAESHVDRSILSDAPFVRTNVLGTQTLLAAAHLAGVKRFVQVSTDEVYGELPWRDPAGGDPSAPRFTEDSPLAPRSPYAATKAAADHLALAYHTTHGMDVVVTRCSNNYGPYQFPEKLIPLFVTNALEGEPLPLYGDGEHVRDWIHVDDHCDAIWHLLGRDDPPGTVYNVSAHDELSNHAVTREILRLLGRDETLVRHVTDRLGHDRRYAIDAGRLMATGWAPARPFTTGLADTIAWYRAHAAWWREIRSGAYRDYYERTYGARLRPGSAGGERA